MRLQELLRILISPIALDKKKIKLVKTILLTGVKKFNSLGYIGQNFFKEAYDASLRLIVTRLRDGLDRDPCSGLYLLVIRAPYHGIQDAGRFRWIDKNISWEDCNYDHTGKKTNLNLVNSKRAQCELVKIKLAVTVGEWMVSKN